MFEAGSYGTMTLLSFAAVLAISSELAKSFDIEDKVLPIICLGCYITLCDTSVLTEVNGVEQLVTNVLSSRFSGAEGMFVAMVTALVATEIYCRLVKADKFAIRLPDAVPPNVGRSFTVLFPAVFTVFIVSGFGMVFKWIFNMSLFDAISFAIQAPLSNVIGSLPGYLLIMSLTNVLWFFGIHGVNVLKPVYITFMLSTLAANSQAYLANESLPYILSTPFQNCFTLTTGGGITGGLIIAILLFSKREEYRSIAKFSLPCAIFNINEPLIFGLPIVMNPIMCIPFIITPIVTSTLGYFLTEIGFAGRMILEAPWTTPPFLDAFLSSGGSIGAGITELLCIAVATLIYIPFVLIANKNADTAPELEESED
ncbi:MAG: PTS transporter subunit EIIC [Butyricicoccus sp.]|nr:PTS transporter subunit EIIC [Butyricicoccus sp.]